VTAGLIVDGIHVDPLVVAAALAALGSERLMLVTDAVGALGLPPGSTQLGTDTVTIGEDGVRLSDGTLAGSDLSMPRALANLVRFTGCTLDDAIASATSTPARLLGLTDRAAIAPGRRGDLVLLDDDLRVVATLVAGDIAFERAR
jgi:N-acetylglucosamine-6-phosphate deacetylase